jgi:hypothetical protein
MDASALNLFVPLPGIIAAIYLAIALARRRTRDG